MKKLTGGGYYKLITLVDINKNNFDPSKSNKEYTYVQIDSVNHYGDINYDYKIIGTQAPSRARRIANKNSVVISTVRPNLKAFAFIDKELSNTIFSTGFAILEVKDESIIRPKWLYYQFKYSKYVMEQITNRMPKGQYPSINIGDIENITISCPNLSIQDKVIREIEKIEFQINILKESLKDQDSKVNKILEETLVLKAVEK